MPSAKKRKTNTMEYVLKKFDELTVHELYEILKLRMAVFVVEQNCPYQDIDDKDKHSHHLICLQNDELAGYLRIVQKGISYEEVSIGRVIVAPEFRNKGIATKLLNHAIGFIADSLGETSIRISAQSHLQKLYGSVGFQPIGEEYLEDDIPHIEMVLE